MKALKIARKGIIADKKVKVKRSLKENNDDAGAVVAVTLK